ncbi:MAG: di-heme oxidoredictase family protein [Pseudomonadota bacterium]
MRPKTMALCRVFAAAFVGAGITALVGSALSSGTPFARAADQTPKLTTKLPADFDPTELRPGGDATSRGSAQTRNAFSQSSGNMGFARELDFKIGNAIFRKLWVSSPASTKSSDGLGPLYNARACQRCHLKDGRGHPPSANWPQDNAVSLLLRLSVPPQTDADRANLASGRAAVIAEPTYGTQLQDLAIKGHAGEGRPHITWHERVVTLGDGTRVSLRKPEITITDLGYGPMHPETMVSPRIAQQMIGLGLLEAIPAADIERRADPDDADGDGISGRTQRGWSHTENRLMLGRFGWKAGQPTILDQSIDAAVGDMGLGSKIAPRASGDCTVNQRICLDAPAGGPAANPGAEFKWPLMKLTAFYSRNLAVPPRRNPTAPNVLRGRDTFRAIGCASCHTPKHVTGTKTPDPYLANQTIWPYTDLLLHDMGAGLADNRPEGRASGREWRTPPLWGIGLTQQVSGHTFFLHDGRARNVTEAILWHGGEARRARDAFADLSKSDRADLIAFVNSL